METVYRERSGSGALTVDGRNAARLIDSMIVNPYSEKSKEAPQS